MEVKILMLIANEMMQKPRRAGTVYLYISFIVSSLLLIVTLFGFRCEESLLRWFQVEELLMFVSGCSVVDQKSIMWRGVAAVEGSILHHIILARIFSVGVCLKYTEIK